ncbi:hypothetical protein KZZ07_15630 [Mameliella sp. CS4]|uniref:hypothetical protein n=1 Tax=Mameliella sp. CS4 TaxID=2862329 RepID=UPI001C5E03B2|nr:hypothetical protein [Mameliella sp. CS4]MBW4983974.1 hypothetical protein [Mameliella sp. CS4]
MEIFVAAVLILASLAGTGLIAYAIRHGQKRREALKALCAERGWSFDYQPQSGGRGSRTVISDPSEGWELVLYYRSNSSTGGTTNHWTEFTQPRLALPDGMALLGPDIPEKTAAMADMMLGKMGGGGLGQMMLNKMTGGLAAEAADLRSVPGDGSGTLFATPGRETALTAIREAPDLLEARSGRNEAQQPIVALSRHGMRLRLRHILRRPEEITDFVELGRALTRRLGA